MTVIAAKVEGDSIVMAADSRVSRGGHGKNTGYQSKIVNGSDFFVGISGSAMVAPMLMAYAKDHGIGTGGDLRIAEWCFEFLAFCNKYTGDWSQEAHLLLAHKTGLYSIYDWLPLRVNDFCAIGSGFEHAEAAMYLGSSPREAVEVSIAMADGCGGAIDVRTMFTE